MSSESTTRWFLMSSLFQWVVWPPCTQERRPPSRHLSCRWALAILGSPPLARSLTTVSVIARGGCTGSRDTSKNGQGRGRGHTKTKTPGVDLERSLLAGTRRSWCTAVGPEAVPEASPRHFRPGGYRTGGLGTDQSDAVPGVLW